MKSERIVWVITVAGLLAGTAWYGSYRTWHPAAPKPRKGKQHIVCIGDSITFGAGVRSQNVLMGISLGLQGFHLPQHALKYKAQLTLNWVIVFLVSYPIVYFPVKDITLLLMMFS